jgi:uncharacterized membrane protein YgaE (UPF0421/DUF939 family)
MGRLIEDMQYRIKTTSGSIALFTSKLFVGLVLGLTFALIGERMVGYQNFAFTLVVVVFTAVFYKISKSWKWAHLAVFSLVCVLLALLLRMYIHVAPGA